eukprot:CAMPEP_0202713726 /NCGR_PEP_ID=MMETSP1385-20130828/58363_1 /ASSEMBLY_ACC=CAM_ASM_000861 /TAXON_ID=933848 /ORGANISM="Elphidium margaritaceum" /LENGTH=173 /DNA_ID=CAMNT_0049374179 /DNA_START=90 /DNA_END=611 /DNA_ORIENTATION=-
MTYGYITRYQFAKRDTLCNEIMRGRLRIKNNSKLSKKDVDKLERYFLEQKAYEIELKPQDGGNGDRGYQHDTNKASSTPTHYNTTIAKSYFALEEAVRSTQPDLRHKNFRTIREFVEEVAVRFPALRDQCYKYIDLYELARFANYKCTKHEFEEFLSLLSFMINGLKDPPHLH